MSNGYDPYNQPQGGSGQGYGQTAEAGYGQNYQQPAYGQGYQQPAYGADAALAYPGYATAGAGAAPGMPPFVTAETAPRDVGFVEAVKLFFKKYAQFRGAASRSEFWYAYLGSILIQLIPLAVMFIGAMVMAAGTQVDQYGYTTQTGNPALLLIGAFLWMVVGLACIVPMLAISWRRLHDSGKSGVWYLVSFVPAIGSIWLLVLFATERHTELWQPEWFV